MRVHAHSCLRRSRWCARRVLQYSSVPGASVPAVSRKVTTTAVRRFSKPTAADRQMINTLLEPRVHFHEQPKTLRLIILVPYLSTSELVPVHMRSYSCIPLGGEEPWAWACNCSCCCCTAVYELVNITTYQHTNRNSEVVYTYEDNRRTRTKEYVQVHTLDNGPNNSLY